MNKAKSGERKGGSCYRDWVQAISFDPLGTDLPQVIAPSRLSSSLSHKVFVLKPIMSVLSLEAK